ncbi:hypothetical protein BJY00DRAFT_284649 [Aspergillus carlsbadensis]|nr:hypothetical protein BJY00DRAFT_284649 [Aspergillus carlsbadensis]
MKPGPLVGKVADRLYSISTIVSPTISCLFPYPQSHTLYHLHHHKNIILTWILHILHVGLSVCS